MGYNGPDGIGYIVNWHGFHIPNNYQKFTMHGQNDLRNIAPRYTSGDDLAFLLKSSFPVCFCILS